MSERKKGTRDPIHKVAHVIRLLRALSPADRAYALAKAGEAEPVQQCLPMIPQRFMKPPECRNCHKQISFDTEHQVFVHVGGDGSCTSVAPVEP